MSPEEELFQLACQDMPVSSDEVRDAMNTWRREIARELAEKIREAKGSPPAYASKSSRFTYSWHAKRNAAVIDPEES